MAKNTDYIRVLDAKFAILTLPTDLDLQTIERCIEAMNHIPSALDLTDNNVGDMISRQAALDCFYGWYDKHGNFNEPDEMPEYQRIEALPSVCMPECMPMYADVSDTISRQAANETIETFFNDSYKLILDACCGGRMFWYDHHEPHTVYVDNRDMDKRVIWTSKDGQQVSEFEVKPDIVADFQHLPFPDNTFWHIVFDPPHLKWAGETSWLAAKYGRLDDNWPEVLANGFRECMRVLKPCGTLIFKWNETQITVREIIQAIGQEPLYGHKSGKGGKTHWLAFMKFPKEKEDEENEKASI